MTHTTFSPSVARLPDWLNKPYAINGNVHIRRYSVTVTEIAEDVEILRERLRELWRTEPRNFHLTKAFRAEAARLGIVLDDDERGSKSTR